MDGTNIGRKDALVSLAASLGFSSDEARRIIEERTYREAVDADWSRSRELGITGVPTFIMDDKRVVGAQPYEVLEALVKERGARRLP